MSPEPSSFASSSSDGKRRRSAARSADGGVQPGLFDAPPSVADAGVEAAAKRGRGDSRSSATSAKKAATKPAKGSTAKRSGRSAAEGSDEPASKQAAAPRRKKKAAREDARSMALRQRDISVSEFFAKNRHLLGFDNPARALLTTVKEAVDNALDACEEADILPDVLVRLEQLAEDRFRVTIEDNGPGIVKAQVPKVFGKLLYGSKFHRSRQSRGQQGIGISAAAMYGQLTTGQPTVVVSRTSRRDDAHRYCLTIDTKKNKPEIVSEDTVEWEKSSGTAVTLELEGSYKKGRRSVDEYVELTALANPHATLRYEAPKADPVVHERVTKELPEAPREIKPHPEGVELGVLARILREAPERHLASALSEHFSRVSPRVAEQVCKEAKLSPKSSPRKISMADAEQLFRAIPKVRILAPPTNCLSPIGDDLIRKALARSVPDADFVDSATRSPTVYRGNPFQVEVGLAYGGSLPGDELAQVHRFANRVPLQYQQGACAMTKAVLSVPWKNYQIPQSSGALPGAPMVLFAHVVSVWVPFTSESKEAVAAYDVILKELRLGFMDVGRRLGTFLRKRKRQVDEMKKRAYIDAYLPHVGYALQDILGLSDDQREGTVEDLRGVLERTRKKV